jgi:hypothetical protein
LGSRRDQSSQWIKAHPLVSLTSGSGPSKCARDGGPPLRLLVATALRKNSITRTSAFIAANASRSSSRHRRRSDAVAGYVTKAFIAVRSYGWNPARPVRAAGDVARGRRRGGCSYPVAFAPPGCVKPVGLLTPPSSAWSRSKRVLGGQWRFWGRYPSGTPVSSSLRPIR